MKNKISAEEKHYIKLNTKLKQDYNKLFNLHTEELVYSIKLQETIDDLKKQIEQLQNENKIILESSGLSVDEIKRLVKGNQAIAGWLGVSKLFGNGW